MQHNNPGGIPSPMDAHPIGAHSILNAMAPHHLPVDLDSTNPEQQVAHTLGSPAAELQSAR